MSYRFYNANIKGNFIDDCVIRAISLAENKTWSETYQELSLKARDNGLMIDDVNFVENYLDSKYKRSCFEKMYVGEFAEEHQDGIYLIIMKGHITCCVDGVIYDTFDCLDRFIWCVWKVK